MRSNVRDVRVQLIDDRAKAYVVFDVHGKDMTLQLEGRLGAQNGYLHFEPLSGQIGSLPIPQPRSSRQCGDSWTRPRIARS
jgi:hypothetical protein